MSSESLLGKWVDSQVARGSWVMEEHEGGHSIGPIFFGGGGSNLMPMWQRCFCFSGICSKMNSHSALFGLVGIKQTPEGCGLVCCLGNHYSTMR